MAKYTDNMEWPLDCKVYVGDCGDNMSRTSLEDAFGRFGKVRNVWVARNPPGFAFVLMDDPDDASEASKAIDGTKIAGRRVKVQMSSGRIRYKKFGEDGNGGYGGGGGGRGGFGGGGGFREGGGGGRRGRSPSRSRSRSPGRRKRSRSPSYGNYKQRAAGDGPAAGGGGRSSRSSSPGTPQRYRREKKERGSPKYTSRGSSSSRSEGAGGGISNK